MKRFLICLILLFLFVIPVFAEDVIPPDTDVTEITTEETVASFTQEELSEILLLMRSQVIIFVLSAALVWLLL